MDEVGGGAPRRLPLKFDLKLVQCYVLARVFELAWTANRFDQFDSHMQSSGRGEAKAERIGKKYQWIAYHEMLACPVTDKAYVQLERRFGNLRVVRCLGCGPVQPCAWSVRGQRQRQKRGPWVWRSRLTDTAVAPLAVALPRNTPLAPLGSNAAMWQTCREVGIRTAIANP